MNEIKVFLVDDHDIFRKGLRLLLEELDYVKIVGEAKNGQEFIEMIKQIECDVVFMDIKMPLLNGYEATKKALEFKPNIKVIALSMYGDEEHLQVMLDSGAKGFLLKNTNLNELEHSMKITLEGKNYFSEELLSVLANLYFTTKSQKENIEEKPKFTKKELEILNLICKGYTSVEIGKMLNLSNRTVDGHRAIMMEKIGAKNTIQLVIYAIENKLVYIL